MMSLTVPWLKTQAIPIWVWLAPVYWCRRAKNWPISRVQRGRRVDPLPEAIRDRDLNRAAETGRSQVAAIGVAQEMQPVFIARKRRTDPSRCPQFSFDKKDRRVTVFYFYLWDAGFGPAARSRRQPPMAGVIGQTPS